MAGDNKILTVSFGTFSCTVEGFDDPLATMREITEYFRDLSSEDRYFGAEPLTPEPERTPMLADRRGTPRVQAAVPQARTAVSRAKPEPEPEPEPAGAVQDPGIHDAVEASDAFGQDTSATTPPEDAATPEPTRAPARADTAAQRLARIRAAAGPDLGAAPAGVEEDEEDAVEPEPPATTTAAPHATFGSADDAAPDADQDPSRRPTRPEAADESPQGSAVQASSPSEVPEDGDQEPNRGEDHHGHGAAAFENSPIDNGGGTADRIFREAGHALEDIEARRRHSAIAHLKAAVSATVNDRNILGWRKRQHEEEEVAYRADLAQAVKPDHAPEAADAGTARMTDRDAEAERAADIAAATADDRDEDGDFAGVEAAEPLILGSDKRVDPNSLAALALSEDDRVLEEETRPVRARSSDESFAEFASRTGARGLSDLLEAAAAFSAQVEGRPQFSRPQIMKHVVGVTGEAYSREDGLRSFGALLRQGKIQKLKRGVFVLSENSRFAPRPRLVGE